MTTAANTVHKQWRARFKVKVLSFKYVFATGTVTHNLGPPLLMHKRWRHSKSPCMKSKCFIVTVLVLLIALAQLQAQQVIRLYSGKAPGSENWTWKEQNLGGYLRDVTDPTLTAFVPSNPNGIAVIIAPGGGFHYLVYELEGTA